MKIADSTVQFFALTFSGLPRMSLTKLKSVDNKTKFKIFGFSRRSEKELSISISIMIQYLVMAYYWIKEHFTKHGECVELNELKTIAKIETIIEEDPEEDDMGSYQYSTVYCNNAINFRDKLQDIDGNLKSTKSMDIICGHLSGLELMHQAIHA